MHPTIDQIFDTAEARYLKPEELRLVTQYVESLPERLETYRSLRDRELEIMQWVADQLQSQLPQESQDLLERSIKNALLMLRYCSMAMLLNDEMLVKRRFLDWVSQTVKVYHTEKIDALLYRLLNQRLAEMLSPSQMNHLAPMLKLAQTSSAVTEPTHSTAIGW